MSKPKPEPKPVPEPITKEISPEEIVKDAFEAWNAARKNPSTIKQKILK